MIKNQVKVNSMQRRFILRSFGWLVWRDIIILRKSLWGKLLDSFIWSINYIIINTYIMPYFGVPQDYGSFIWVGTIVTMAFFESVNSANDVVHDLAGDKMLEHTLTLPLPAWLVFARIGLNIAIDGMALSIFIVPLGKLILLDRLDLSHFSFIKFILIFVTINLFFGAFALWVSSWAHDAYRFSYVRRRIVNPLWLFGGYQFSWFVFYQAFPRSAMVILLNPITYTFEGMRAAILGQAGYLNFWASLSVLWLFIILFTIWAIIWMKKRLDCV